VETASAETHANDSSQNLFREETENEVSMVEHSSPEEPVTEAYTEESIIRPGTTITEFTNNASSKGDDVEDQ
jgi:hypothetical protein